MIRTKKRLTVCTALILCNIAFIWGNSMMPREVSSAISDFVGQIISWFVPGVEVQGGTPGHGVLRKIAHFLEFCSLGFLLSWLWRMCRDKKWQHYVLPLAMGAAVACIDETIQIFAVDRGPGIRDVCIDTAGVLLGVLLMALLALVFRKKT